MVYITRRKRKKPLYFSVFDLFCKDLYAGCKANFDICHTPDYADWTRTGCEKTCGYCYSSVDPAPVG